MASRGFRARRKDATLGDWNKGRAGRRLRVGTMIGTMAEFFAMGGYAAFVWAAYGVAAAVMVGLLAATLRGLRRREALLRTLEGGRVRRRGYAAREGRPAAQGSPR